jgi:hypothetical protein
MACARAADVAAVKFVSPEYEAVMTCVPLERADVERAACPLVRVCVPMIVVPSRKVTVPVGVPAAGDAAVTVAVNITDPANSDGLAFEARATTEPPLLTTWARNAESAAVKFVSPA